MPVVPAPSRSPLNVEEALRVPGAALTPTGLAYDSVSGRFVVGDGPKRKLQVIDERSRHVIDLVGSGSAGFYDITALEIDPHRGDLWVVSADDQVADAGRQSGTALHKLQLISGRPLSLLPVPDDLKPARFADVAVTARGTVFVLDSVGARIFRLAAGRSSMAVAITLGLKGPTSLGPAGDRLIYVAHTEGVACVDLTARTVRAVTGSKKVPLTGLERIRWERNALVGIQRTTDGGRRAVRVRLSSSGRRALAVEILDADVPMAHPTAAALSGDVFYFLTEGSSAGGSDPALIVRRVRLR